jgi:antitoxin HicB
MTAGEFIRRIRALGAARGVPIRFDETRGKGSHGTLYYGDRFIVVKNRRKERGPGLLNKMLSDFESEPARSEVTDMERRFAYPAKVEQDEAGFFLVTFPDFPEAATDGRSREEALAEAADCLEEAVAGRIKRGEDIPLPSRACEGMAPVALSTLYAMKAALYLALRDAELSEAGLAARLGRDEKEIRRLLDPRHASRPEALEAALHAVGKRVQVVIEDQA